MFDQIQPITQGIPQIPQERSSKYMTVFELIEANGLTLHGDIEHFAALVRADERAAFKAEVERALKLALKALENISTALGEDDVLGSDIELMLNAITAIEEALHQAKLKEKNT